MNFHKIILIAIISSLLVSCSSASTQSPNVTVTSKVTVTSAPTETPTPTFTPSPTIVACPPEGTPLVIGDLQVFFEDGVDCDTFAKIIMTANKWAKDKNVLLEGDVRIFLTDASTIEFVKGWAPKIECSPSGANNVSYPSRNGFPSVVVINDSESGEKDDSLSIIHELVHTIQNAQFPKYIKQCGPEVPSWQREGHAQYEAFSALLPYYGMDIDPDTVSRCKDMALSTLVPSREGCVYMMGRRAYFLLEQLCEKDYSFEVWKDFSKTGDFGTSFKTVYGISPKVFERDYFNPFRDNSYILDPELEGSLNCSTAKD